MIPFNRIMNSSRPRQLLNRADNAGYPVGRMLAAFGSQGGGPESQSTMSATPLATAQTHISSEPVGGRERAGLAQRIAQARRAAKVQARDAVMAGRDQQQAPAPQDQASPSSDKAMNEEALMLSRKRAQQQPAAMEKQEPADPMRPLDVPQSPLSEEPEANTADSEDGEEEKVMHSRYAKRIKLANSGV